MAITIKFKSAQLPYLAIFVLYLIWQFTRAPDVFFEGRYFAEEGSVFYSHALSTSFFNHVFFISPLAGYFLLNANLQTGIASILPIEFGPFFTVWTSFAFMALPALLLFSFCTEVKFQRIKLLFFVLLLFSPYANYPEIFANSINSQIYLGLSTFVIFLFFSNIKSTGSKIFVWIILFLSFLSGYYSLALLPMLIYRRLKEGSSPFISNILILGLVSLMFQFTITLNMIFSDTLWPTKLGPSKFTIQYFNEFVVWLFNNFLLDQDLGNLSLILIVFFLVGLLLPGGDLSINFKGQLLIGFTIQLFLIYFGSAEFSDRYLALVLTILSLSVVTSVAEFFRSRFFNIIAYVQVFIITLILFYSFTFIQNYNDPFLVCSTDCVNFSDQVTKIKNEGYQYLYHWPMGTNTMDWFTNMRDPKIELAPFQKNMIGIN